MNDANEADVTNISRYVVVPNQASIDTYLGSYIQDICKNSTYNLQTQENIDIVYEN
jgi:hypothetical protein